MTPERLAEIRKLTDEWPGNNRLGYCEVADLLAHCDAQAEEVERLRKDRDYHQHGAQQERATSDRLRGALREALDLTDHDGELCRAVHELDGRNSRPFRFCSICTARQTLRAALPPSPEPTPRPPPEVLAQRAPPPPAVLVADEPDRQPAASGRLLWAHPVAAPREPLHNAAPTTGEAHGAEAEHRESCPLPGTGNGPRDAVCAEDVPGHHHRGPLTGLRQPVRDDGRGPHEPDQRDALGQSGGGGALELATSHVAATGAPAVSGSAPREPESLPQPSTVQGSDKLPTNSGATHDCAQNGCGAEPAPRGMDAAAAIGLRRCEETGLLRQLEEAMRAEAPRETGATPLFHCACSVWPSAHPSHCAMCRGKIRPMGTTPPPEAPRETEPRRFTEAEVGRALGYVSVDIPELHSVHPERLLASFRRALDGEGET